MSRLSFSMSREQVAEVAKILGYQARFHPPEHPARTAYELFRDRLERTQESQQQPEAEVCDGP